MSEREYKNVVVCGAWPTQGGHMNTMPFDLVAIDKMQALLDDWRQQIKEGKHAGKFLIRKRTEASMSTARPGASPFFIEGVPASEVQAFEASRPKKDYL